MENWKKMNQLDRRKFLKQTALATSAVALPGGRALWEWAPKAKMKLGLVTYLWGKDMDIPTLISSCKASKLKGVELRVEHAHGVHLGMSASELEKVRQQFADSPIEVVGMGTNEEFDSPDPAVLKENIERAKGWVRVSQAIGGTGVKVKPNKFHEGIPQEKTLEQIGRSLNELGAYAADHGQVIRLEVHGRGTQQLPNIKTIMDHAPHPSVGVCWNCNEQDLDGQGLEYNFNLVKDRLSDIVHVREMNVGDYPYAELMQLLKDNDYDGWILLECRTEQEDKIAAMKEQYKVFKKLT